MTICGVTEVADFQAPGRVGAGGRQTKKGVKIAKKASSERKQQLNERMLCWAELDLCFPFSRDSRKINGSLIKKIRRTRHKKQEGETENTPDIWSKRKQKYQQKEATNQNTSLEWVIFIIEGLVQDEENCVTSREEEEGEETAGGVNHNVAVVISQIL